MTAATSLLGKLNRFRWRTATFLAKGPSYLYIYGRWLLVRRWLKLKEALFARQIDDVALINALDLGQAELAAVKKAMTQKDLETAQQALVTHFKTRTRPRFHFDAADKAHILAAIPGDQRAATVRTADEVCRNTFQFRRTDPVTFDAAVDWAWRPQGNVDWTWDLNRHAYFNALGQAYWYTGEARYAAKFVELLRDWIDKNPAGVHQPNWASVLEIGARLNNWIWAYHFFRHAAAFDREAQIAFLKGLLTLARQLCARLEHHATNNHLFLEAKALAFCGLLFPEFREAATWRETGLGILWVQVEKQVCLDGVHAERSTLYHRAVTSELLELAVLLDNNGLPIPEPVLDRLDKMLAFDLHVTKPDGTMPLLGDSSLTDNYVRFAGRHGRAVLFDKLELAGNGSDAEMAWLLAKKHVGPHQARASTTPRLNSQAFPEGGYFVMRGGEGASARYLIFDCGPFGYRPVPGHGHADALSFDLYAYGRSLITDCGAFSYYLGQNWRNYFRGTRAHNTVVVDGQDQTILMGTRHVYRMAQARLHRWVSNASLDFVDGSHDGYQRLAEPVSHRRKLLFVKPDYWIVVDFLTGRGTHTLEQLFHLLPWATPRVDQKTGVVQVDDDSGRPALTIVPVNTASLQAQVVSGATDPIQGWVSFYSGEKIAAPVLVYQKTVSLPAVFCTVLYPHPPHGDLEFAVVDLAVQTAVAAGAPVSGLTVETADHVDTFVIALDDAPSPKTFAGFQSDASVVFLRRRKSDDRLIKKVLIPQTTELRGIDEQRSAVEPKTHPTF